jgi:hypothetical protein
MPVLVRSVLVSRAAGMPTRRMPPFGLPSRRMAGWQSRPSHERHLASNRTSCSKAGANQFRLLVHTAAFWLIHRLRGLDVARLGTETLVLAPCAVRYDTVRATQSRRSRHRIGDPYQGRAAVGLSLSTDLGLARRKGRQAAIVNGGAECRHSLVPSTTLTRQAPLRSRSNRTPNARPCHASASPNPGMMNYPG